MTRLLLAVALVCSAGCAPRTAVSLRGAAPATLSDLNTLLATDIQVSIELTSGEALEAREVRVGADSVRYVSAGTPGGARARDVREVERIVYARRSGALPGAAVGATPGLALTALGIGFARLFEGEGLADLGFMTFGYGVAALGGLYAGVGAAAGAEAGARSRPGGSRVLYQSPIDRYLTARPDPAPITDS